MKVPSKFQFSNKHIKIDKNYAKMVGAIAASSAVIIFCLVVSGSLFKQIQYQNKVIGLRDKAAKQLKANVDSAGKLVAAYEAFDGATESVLANSDKNSKIILDALPSKYDYPALATSLEYLVKQSGMEFKGIIGVDKAADAEQNSVSPTVSDMPFELTVSGDFATSKKFITNLERSIRPFSISEMTISGGDKSLMVNIKGTTYYQPEKKLEIKQQTVTNGSAVKKTTTTSTTNSTTTGAVKK